MAGKMTAIKKDTRRVGYAYRSSRGFGGCSTPAVAPRNTYLTVGEKPALVFAVRHDGFGEMPQAIRIKINPVKIKYMVFNQAKTGYLRPIGKRLRPSGGREAAGCRPSC